MFLHKASTFEKQLIITGFAKFVRLAASIFFYNDYYICLDDRFIKTISSCVNVWFLATNLVDSQNACQLQTE